MMIIIHTILMFISIIAIRNQLWHLRKDEKPFGKVNGYIWVAQGDREVYELFGDMQHDWILKDLQHDFQWIWENVWKGLNNELWSVCYFTDNAGVRHVLTKDPDVADALIDKTYKRNATTNEWEYDITLEFFSLREFMKHENSPIEDNVLIKVINKDK